NLVLLGWLVGLLFGGIVGSLSQMWEPLNRRLSFVEAYRYRWLCLWWLKRPFATEVEAALRLYQGHDSWVKSLLGELDAQQQQPDLLGRLVPRLDNVSWFKRIVAQHAIVALGGENVSYLLNVGRAKINPLSHTRRWLIQSISYDTETRLGRQAGQILCPSCMTVCGPHSVRQSNLAVTYYGCRTCGRSRNLLHCPEGIVAVLDAAMPEAQHYQDGLLSLNWLARRELFDFNAVEITNATDEDVERFAVQVGKDAGAVRQARYGQMVCHINGTQSRLSENTLRILQRTFGQVSHK
ncbi:MAG: hypothetical protein GY792_22115, partial [Gammaproteobacteria bacterium]|nr:hypothetical protein [Gammaproteobacteria bacterium]